MCHQRGKYQVLANFLVMSCVMSRIMRKQNFCICENKVTEKLISAFVFATWIVQSLYFRNFKLLAFYRDCTDRFVSDLVGNLEDRFSPVTAVIIICYFKNN